MSYTKKSETKTKTQNVESVTEEVAEEPVVKTATTATKTNTKKSTTKVEEKTIANSELIPCRSVTEGTLIYIPGKDKDPYIWEGFGDITEVAYGDLLSLRARKSSFLFDPLFMIEDDELLELSRWKELKNFYDNMYSTEDVEEIVNLPINAFKSVFKGLPKGVQKAVYTEISTQIEAGTFDSLQKIKFVDETIGSDLACLL